MAYAQLIQTIIAAGFFSNKFRRRERERGSREKA
jgi:hypothetical protein